MGPAAQHEQAFARKLGAEQFSLDVFHDFPRKARNFAIGQADEILEIRVRESQAGPEHQAEGAFAAANPLACGLGRVFHVMGAGHDFLLQPLFS